MQHVTADQSGQLTTRPVGATRRHDLDWLRVLAFGVLVFFHAAVVFLPQGIPMIQNAQPAGAAQWFVAFLHQFRLPLLFLVSGMGVAFAFRRRSNRAFFDNRTTRLVIPLLFGIFVLVPPMVYLEKRFIGAIEPGFAAFYPDFFTTGVYPYGHLSWHHFWFLAYLYLYCLIVLAWRRFASPDVFARAERFASIFGPGARIYLFATVLLAIELPLRPVFGGTRDLINDQANFWLWFAIFCAGVAFARDTRHLESAERLRMRSLAAALTLTALLFAAFYIETPRGYTLTPVVDGHVSVPGYVLFSALRIGMIWCWLLTCTGFAAAYLNRPGRVLSVLNDAVYPMFCLHLPATVALAYVVVPLGWPSAAKYGAIVAGTFAFVAITYVAVRHLAPRAGVLIGMSGSR